MKKIKQGDFFHADFKETLGQGRFCKVKRVNGHFPSAEEYNIPYAVKIFKKGMLRSIPWNTLLKLSTMLAKADLEITLIGKFDHPNISKCLFVYD
jgi:hypothetical protein